MIFLRAIVEGAALLAFGMALLAFSAVVAWLLFFGASWAADAVGMNQDIGHKALLSFFAVSAFGVFVVLRWRELSARSKP